MSCCCTTVETGTVKVRARAAAVRTRGKPAPRDLSPHSLGCLQIVERCGEFSTILNPGLSIIVPCIDVPTNPISMRLQQIEVSCETKTKDNVFTQMKVSGRRRIFLPSAQCVRSARCPARLGWRDAPHALRARCAGLHPVPDRAGR